MTIPEAVRIRQMMEGDLAEVTAIERASDSAPHWGETDYLALFQGDNDESFKRIANVAEVAGVVAGYVIVRLVGGAGIPEAEIESVAVAPTWRRRGLGVLLLSDAIREVKELGAVRLDLEVRASNSAAIRLYRRAGFVETGRRRAYYQDPEEDAVLMSVTL